MYHATIPRESGYYWIGFMSPASPGALVFVLCDGERREVWLLVRRYQAEIPRNRGGEVMTDSCSVRENDRWTAYVVTAYRWGLRDAHSYVVGAYRDREEAVRVAREHVNFRGGKYGCEVVECRGPAQADEGGENAIEKQVAYFESSYPGPGQSADDAKPRFLDYDPSEIKYR